MEKKIFIITEASTDRDIITKLIEDNSIFDSSKLYFQFHHGINDAYKYIDNLSTESRITKNNVENILIIVDSDDEDIEDRFNRIVSKLKKQWDILKKMKIDVSEIPDKFLRLFSRAPRTTILSCMAFSRHSFCQRDGHLFYIIAILLRITTVNCIKFPLGED